MSFRLAATLLDPNAIRAELTDFQRELAPAPTLQTFENAAQAAYDPSTAASLGLTTLLDKTGNPVTETLASGMSATAFVDGTGNLIVAYQGTSTSAQYQLDTSLLDGTNASSLQGFQDAVTFASHAQAVARGHGIDQTKMFVTGHSLGGTLAEYVASKTGLGGMSFAGAGIPGFQAPTTPSANFVSYVENGDPFANYGTDTAEKGSAVVANPKFDHVGTVVTLGTAGAAASMAGFASEISGYTFAQLETGDIPGGSQAAASVVQQEQTLMDAYHGLGTYDTDADSAVVPATAYGLQNTSLTDFLVAMARQSAALGRDLPTIFKAGSPGAMLDAFAGDFPTLAREATSLMHAGSFSASIGMLATVDPALSNQMSSLKGAMAVVEAINRLHHGPIFPQHAL